MKVSVESGLVVWITGLSAAGKTTLAQQVVEHMRRSQYQVVHLDGDELRKVFVTPESNGTGYDKNARLQLAYQYAALCKVLAEQGTDVVISTISMFSEIYDWNRENIKNYLEIFLDIPLEIREQRDPKGLYARFRNNQVQHVAGLDLPIDIPTHSDLILKGGHAQAEINQLKQVIELINLRKKPWRKHCQLGTLVD